MIKLLLSTAIALAFPGGAAIAQLTPSPTLAAPPPMVMAPIVMAPPVVVAPSSVVTPAGPAFINGTGGGLPSVMLPGSAVPGTMLNNGNGTSTILVPGGPSQVVPTPR